MWLIVDDTLEGMDDRAKHGSVANKDGGGSDIRQASTRVGGKPTNESTNGRNTNTLILILKDWGSIPLA